ncbi:type VII secretion protein EccB [Kitasatospora sp. NPDC088346]|uniref:type VII secretion protein EccB n=1 Tax=Kitasatospora sp. NPDC088346 TaxID=3364073 RepID=UPI0037F5FBC4
MASRRDELNAYTFARKRMVGAFLQPSGGGNDEDAPRPIRAVLPSFVVAAVVVAGFGMWGVIKPSAPLNWDSGKYIVQAKQSTTRYVVLKDASGKGVLHQVLNMSSARLVLPANATVMSVADDVLDKYPRHGATIGIPYAPDRLPKSDDAGKAKLWSVCDRLGNANNTQGSISQAVFVAADKDAAALKDQRMLTEGQALYVQGPTVSGQPGGKYLVDSNGAKHAVGPNAQAVDQLAMESALFGRDAKPQQVTADWLQTLANGKAILFPEIPDYTSAKVVQSAVSDPLPAAERRVGRVLQFQDSYFVVGLNRLYSVTPFQAELILNFPSLDTAYDKKKPVPYQLTPAENAGLAPKVDPDAMRPKSDIPTVKIEKALNVGNGNEDRAIVCSTFEGIENNVVKQSVWAGVKYPADIDSGSLSAHVTAGHGLFYRAVDSVGEGGSGSDFLITETGLRYSLPNNNDAVGTKAGGASASPSAAPAPAPAGESKDGNESQARLGYKDVTPTLVPLAWSRLVPAGPVLSRAAAEQAQNA